MAKLGVFVVFDAKVQAYMQPFFARTPGEAVRMWEGTVNDPSDRNLIHKHPGDFQMFQSAEYDESTGRFHQLPELRPYGTGLEAKKDIPATAPLGSRANPAVL